MTRLASGLPKGDANGLTALARPLIDTPEMVHVAIVLLDCKKIATEIDTGDVEATARILRLEAVLPQDHKVAEKLMRRSLEKRTGKVMLPFELEEQLRNAFGSVDPGTGEVLGDQS